MDEKLEKVQKQDNFIKLGKPIENIPKELRDRFNPIPEAYSDDENEKFKTLREYIDTISEYPVLKKDAINFVENIDLDKIELELLKDIERCWLSDKCLYRYLRSCKWDLKDTKKRLISTIVWRREFGIVKMKEEEKMENEKSKYIGFDDIEEENKTGKQVILGYDNELRPILYLKPGRKCSDPSERQVKHSIFMLERCVDFMEEEAQDTLTLVMDFKRKYKDLENLPKRKPAMNIGIEVMNLLQTHYPERLGKAFLFNIHWIAKGCLRLITPFMDPKTRGKIIYDVENIEDFIAREELDKNYGGLILFEYDHEEYWPALKDIIARKRKEKYKDISI